MLSLFVPQLQPGTFSNPVNVRRFAHLRSPAQSESSSQSPVHNAHWPLVKKSVHGLPTNCISVDGDVGGVGVGGVGAGGVGVEVVGVEVVGAGGVGVEVVGV